ncbi:MAG TPA: PH domain-containing protein [Thermoanaerobaculia bacterium]|nr:PH domain-containing protein [Thermoanaerobaculia bacterium]
MSIFTVVVLGGVAVAVALEVPAVGKGAWILPLVVGSSAFVLVACALFTIRGYRLDATAIYVQRLLWETRIPLRGLTTAWASGDAMKGSIRLAGNGGAFSFSGLYRSKRLGRYRAFVTAPALSVVLELADKTVVITPDSPQRFLDRLAALYAEAEIL